MRIGSDPLDVVLFVPLNEVDTLQDVCDVVDPPLLDAELLHGLVQVQSSVGLLAEQVYEIVRQLDQAVLLPSSHVGHHNRLG